jgi:hypothetical protein
MSKKRILVLISGQLRYFSIKNYENLIKNFKDYELDFFIACWDNQGEEIIKLFKKNYNPINLIEIKTRNFSLESNNVKYPDNEVNTENTFHMWYSFSEGCKKIKNLSFGEKPDYILRYRSDILPDFNQVFINKEPKQKQILIPDTYHWNGINDQFFLFNYLDIDYFTEVIDYLEDYQKKNLFFSPELIFQRFLKKRKFKINYIDYNYRIMRKLKKDNKNFKKIKITKIPLFDKIFIKLNKLKFKLRNFNNFFINKSKRNNQQDIIIE